MNINIIDIAIVLLILMSGFSGLKKGVLKSFVNFVGTIIVYVLAFLFKNRVGIILCKFCPFFSFDGYPTLNILLYQMVAFVLIAGVLFTIFNFVMKATGIVQKLFDMTIILKLPSSILGFIVGLVEGYIVMFVIITILAIPFRNVEMYQESSLVNIIMNKSPILSKSLGEVVDSIYDVFTITSNIENGTMSQKNKTNLDIIEACLDHNVISREDALDIIDMDKFDTIPGIRQFVYSYQKN